MRPKLTRAVYAQIVRINEDTREVTGRVTSEAVDSYSEVMDYDSSAPLFRSWSERFADVTKGGSLGNVREMHEPSAVGKLTALACNDADKTIDCTAKIVDDDAWKKVVECVYTGFSLGGQLVGKKRWKDPETGVTRYTVQPNEVSVVDNPANPDATFCRVHGGVETVCKFGATAAAESSAADDGAAVNANAPVAEPAAVAPLVEEVPPVEKSAVTVAPVVESSPAATGAPGTVTADPYERVARALKLECEDVTPRALVEAHGVMLACKRTPAAQMVLASVQRMLVVDDAVTKGMWGVYDLAMLIGNLQYQALNAEAEAAAEQDNSPVPAQLVGALRALCNALVEMAAEETAEVMACFGAPETAAELVAMTATPEGVDGVVRMFAAVRKRMTDPTSGSNDAELRDAVLKAAGAIAKLETDNATLKSRNAELEQLNATRLAGPGLFAVTKTVSVAPDAPLEVTPVVRNGAVDPVATAIKLSLTQPKQVGPRAA